MTTRRHQLTTADGRIRLVRAAGAYILERAAFNLADVDLMPSVTDVATEASGRLHTVGLTNATPAILCAYAMALDSVDGLTTGRYDPDMWGSPEHTRDGLIRGYEGVVDLCEGLAVLAV